MQASWKLKSACLRIRARVDKGAATPFARRYHDASISGRKREE